MREATPGQPLFVSVSMTLVHCAQCGTPFGVSEDLLRRRREDGKDFWCPVGHVNHYKGGIEAVKKELADAKARLQATEQALLDEKRAHARTHDKLKAAEKPKEEKAEHPPKAEKVEVPDATLSTRILEHLVGKPEGSYYGAIAGALGANKGTVSATCSSLVQQKKLVRPEAGVYKLAEEAPPA